jgi:outer membrane protein assembly factor BamB
MQLLKKILKWIGITAALAGVTAAVLYQFFGLRVVFYGGGVIRLEFITTASAQANAIEEHRKAQSAAAPTTEIPAVPAPPAGPVPTSDKAAPSTSPAESSTSSWPDFRGPRRDGHYTGQPIVTTWPNGALKPIWKQPVGGGYASFVAAQWGMAASPLIVDDAIVVLPGGGAGRSVAAYNHRTGAPVWHAHDDRAAYSSPMLVSIDGVRQILVVGATRMIGMAPNNGTLLWEYRKNRVYLKEMAAFDLRR